MFYEVIPIKLFRKNAASLTYSSNSPLKIGQIVVVPIGKATSPAIVIKQTVAPIFKTRPIFGVVYDSPLPKHLIKLILWFSEYYLTPPPLVANLILPQGITKKRRQKTEQEPPKPQKIPIIELNNAQKTALKAIYGSNKATKLLHGVTGSGKTNIYLEMAKNALKQQKSTILLVPEIALTSQLVRVFENTFGGNIILIHSKQTESERHQIWEKILSSSSPQIIIGPRSALFAPIKNLGLIIVDEAHESAYNQENTPKYSTLRLCSFIAKTLKIPCIFGTATPLISDYFLAKKHQSLISLKEKAKKTAISPKISIIDLKNKQKFTKNRYFSDQLLSEISENLKNHQQTLIFHNRRGSAPLTLCEQCSWQALCPHCFLPLTLHSDSYTLICHSCGFLSKLPNSCPNCHSTNIIHRGFGTKLLESNLKSIFKNAKIARFDADNSKNSSLDQMYNAVHSGEIDIIIGTQTIARGLDLPNLATVGIVQADSGLNLPDFSAEERTFSLISQVIGRVGRGHTRKSSVIIQTFAPNSPIIKYSSLADYENFYNFCLKNRQKQHFPPFFYLAKISVTYKTEKTTIQKIKRIHQALSAFKNIHISPPSPSFHEHTASGYTWQIIIKSTSRTNILSAVKTINQSINYHIYLDPPSLL